MFTLALFPAHKVFTLSWRLCKIEEISVRHLHSVTGKSRITLNIVYSIYMRGCRFEALLVTASFIFKKIIKPWYLIDISIVSQKSRELLSTISISSQANYIVKLNQCLVDMTSSTLWQLPDRMLPFFISSRVRRSEAILVTASVAF